MQRRSSDNLPKQIIDAQVSEHRLGGIRHFAGTPRQIDRMLREFVYGQEAAAQTLSVVLYNHVRHAQAVLAGGDVQPASPMSRILLIGPSGTGKTHFARTMAAVTSLGVRIADAASLSEAAYVGNSVDDLVFGLIASCHNCRELASISIIVIDEIDKLRRQDTRGYRDPSGVGAQESLLNLLGGGELTVKSYGGDKSLHWSESFSAKHTMILGAGAFVGLDDIVRRRLKGKTHMGFSGRETPKEREAERHDILEEVTPEDLIEFGMIPELVGRFGVIQALRPLSADARLDILSTSPHGPVVTLQHLAQLAGFRLRFTTPLLLRIIEMTDGSPVGVRAMFGVAHRVTQRAFYEVPDQLRRSRYAVPIVTIGMDSLVDGSYSLKWSAAKEEPAVELEDLMET